ncbi:MAG: transposase [Planctomycetaceae bacterium]
MVNRRVDDSQGHLHFVTFSCDRRRKFLEPDRAKRVVIGQLGSRLSRHDGHCLGFVLMPDHVHAPVWFPATCPLSPFMNKWKDQSSAMLKRLFAQEFPKYWATVDPSDPIWQARYYGFNIWTRHKVEEQLTYLHENPVRAGHVARGVDWPWSSARWYELGRSVGVPIRWPPGLELDSD